MNVEFHAPPPGSASGVADYAEILHAALRPLCSGGPSISLFHIGNNRLHAAIYARALETPGVTVLHDAVLHHLMLGTKSQPEYMAEWVYNYGEWRREMGEELWRERGRAAIDPRYFSFPMIRRICERSRAVVVHNSGAAEMARAHGAARVHTIPHFYVPPEGEPGVREMEKFRERLGVSRTTVLFGVFGYLREPKRIPACIAAFRRLHAIRPDTALLLAGEPVSGDLARWMRLEAAHPAIHRMSHLSERDLGIAIASIDACLNLRCPGAGETSGIAIRAMGAGKPVIVTAGPEVSNFPLCAVLGVTPGVAESGELFDHMVLVTDFPRTARAIGEEARVHISRHHALEPVVRQYWDVLCGAAS